VCLIVYVCVCACVMEIEKECVCVKSERYANKTTFYIQIVNFVNVEQAESRCLKFIKSFTN